MLSQPTYPAIDAHLDDFQAKVVEASHAKPVLVDFWADWCAPCHALTPHLNRALLQMQDAITLVKVEVDEGENMKLAGHYRLRGFPTLILFSAGAEVARVSGSHPTHWLVQWLTQHLAD
jgi:putative thioredoxin